MLEVAVDGAVVCIKAASEVGNTADFLSNFATGTSYITTATAMILQAGQREAAAQAGQRQAAAQAWVI